MGVRTSHYVVLGAKLPYKPGDSERYEAYEFSSWKPKKSGLVVIVDGMSGDYIIVGHMLAATGNDESADYFFEPTEITLTPKMFEAAKKDVLDKLGLDIEPKLVVLTHHT